MEHQMTMLEHFVSTTTGTFVGATLATTLGILIANYVMKRVWGW